MNPIVMMVCVALSGTTAPVDGWKQVQDGDVKVFTRAHAGSRVLEVRGEADIAATTLELQNVFLDKDPRVAKTPYVVESRSIRDIDSTTYVSYKHLALPVVEDRDFFIEVHNDLLGADGTGTFKSSWKPWGLDRPARANIVRIITNEGYCLVAPSDRAGYSHVTYYLLSDPGGSLPSAFINMGNKRIMPDVMKDLQKKVIDRRARDQADARAAAMVSKK